MGTVAAIPMLQAARSHLGELESPPNSDLHPTVTWYRQAVEDIGRAWPYCAAGVSREFAESDPACLPRPRAYVPWMMGDFDRLGALHWGPDGIQAGDVVFFDWSRPSNPQRSVWAGDHVGVAESDYNGSTVTTIEHNTSVPGTGNEGVARKVRDGKYILGYGRPDWSKARPNVGGGSSAPIGKPHPAPASGRLAIDGLWGPGTTRRLQQIAGTTVDGVISGQTAWVLAHNDLDSSVWRIGTGGSDWVRWLQRGLTRADRYTGAVDGIFGPGTRRGLQLHLGLNLPARDQRITRPSETVRRLQAKANTGRIF